MIPTFTENMNIDDKTFNNKTEQKASIGNKRYAIETESLASAGNKLYNAETQAKALWEEMLDAGVEDTTLVSEAIALSKETRTEDTRSFNK
jgi:hypothetical protein